MNQPMPVPGVDPSGVNTPAELAACLDGLRRRRNLSYEAMEKAARNRRSRPGIPRWESLGKSTVGEIVKGKRVPTKGKLLTFLAVCEVTRADVPLWLAAWERASTAHLTAPADGVRVRDARPRWLGVHDSIRVEGAPGELPIYVPRDIDGELRALIAVGAEQGSFVLLVGGSSVGKTRTLYEAIRAVLPDWWLVHPGRDDISIIRALTAVPTPRTVVWLDELQRYLEDEGGLTADTVRTLLRSGVVLVGTMWPNEYGARITYSQSRLGSVYPPDRELLNLAQVVDVADTFTMPERIRASELAKVDGRLRVALESTEDGMTQVLAAGPELVRWWEQSSNPYAKAVITAALDVRRLGARAPATRTFLAGAAPGYLTSTQRAQAPVDWLDQALAHASTPLHGVVAALSPVDAGVGEVAGYVSAWIHRSMSQSDGAYAGQQAI
jgi:hypothetical protein